MASHVHLGMLEAENLKLNQIKVWHVDVCRLDSVTFKNW